MLSFNSNLLIFLLKIIDLLGIFFFDKYNLINKNFSDITRKLSFTTFYVFSFMKKDELMFFFNYTEVSWFYRSRSRLVTCTYVSVFYLWRCRTVNITYKRMNRCYTKPKMIINQYFPQCWLLNESINTKNSVDFLKANVHELIICILKTYRKYFFFMLTPCNLHVSQNN